MSPPAPRFPLIITAVTRSVTSSPGASSPAAGASAPATFTTPTPAATTASCGPTKDAGSCWSSRLKITCRQSLQAAEKEALSTPNSQKGPTPKVHASHQLGENSLRLSPPDTLGVGCWFFWELTASVPY